MRDGILLIVIPLVAFLASNYTKAELCKETKLETGIVISECR
jgi:hypothetical protein